MVNSTTNWFECEQVASTARTGSTETERTERSTPGGTVEVRNITADWLIKLKPWQTFNTLTFRDPREPDVAWRYWRRLIQVLNRDAFGKNYVQKVGHCYFSYMVALEYQKREVVHFHFVADRPLNFDLVHSWWNSAAGFAWLEAMRDREGAVRYATKYLLKSDSGLQIFENEKQRTPLIKGPQGCYYPYWWVLPKSRDRQLRVQA
jgi:hypothetical protein